MSKIKFYLIVLMAAVAISSCNNDDDDETVTPLRDYAEQYEKDLDSIEKFLNTNYISEIVDKPGFPEDQDVTLKEIPEGGTQSNLMSYLDSPTLPRLTSRNVKMGDVTYKIYILLIREGVAGGENASGGEYPCNVDGVYAGYKGTLLDGTVFDSSNNGQLLWNLDGSSHDGGSSVIRGWAEGFPEFKTGWMSSNVDGTIRYDGFGVGVIFLPSAMAYYNVSQGDIPAYSPLLFSVKLYGLKRYDHDLDGIPSFQEDIDGDRYIYYLSSGETNVDDTDGDGIPNAFDFDDDGDGYSTRGEIKDENGDYYAFDKIPDCSGNQTNPSRIKRHLDKDCVKMNQ